MGCRRHGQPGGSCGEHGGDRRRPVHPHRSAPQGYVRRPRPAHRHQVHYPAHGLRRVSRLPSPRSLPCRSHRSPLRRRCRRSSSPRFQRPGSRPQQRRHRRPHRRRRAHQGLTALLPRRSTLPKRPHAYLAAPCADSAAAVDRPTRSLDVLSYLGAQRRLQHLPRPIPADGVEVELNALTVLFAGDYPQRWRALLGRFTPPYCSDKQEGTPRSSAHARSTTSGYIPRRLTIPSLRRRPARTRRLRGRR
jgi:hypothetical protein